MTSPAHVSSSTDRRASSERTRRLAALDHAHVWHPFTPMATWRAEEPVIIERAEGDELIDTEGRRYIDGTSSLWCNVHGHRVPEIDDAVRGQLDRVAHSTMLGLASVPSIELAKALVDRLPGADDPELPDERRLRHVFYSDAGATATELAFKMAIGAHYHRGAPDRNTIVAFSGAYHGDTVGAMSVGYSEQFHRPFASLVFRTEFCPAPDVTHAPEAADADGDWPWWQPAIREAVRERCLGAFRARLDELGDVTGAVSIEPLVPGAPGMVPHPEGFLSGVAETCRERGIPLVADEVAVGFGRTGTMFACAREGVVPDVICLAKGLSAGYLPLAATCCATPIESAFLGEPWEHRTLYHGHTYTGNPLACAAALASIERFERLDLLDRVARHERLIAERLEAALRDHPHVGDVRQRGLMTGIELVESRRPWRPFDPKRRIGHAVCMACRPHGLIVRPLGDVVILMPMPGMETSTLERLLGIITDVIRDFRF